MYKSRIKAITLLVGLAVAGTVNAGYVAKFHIKGLPAASAEVQGLPPPPPAPCSSPWGGPNIQSGAQVTAYQAASVSYGQTCQSETRVCTNGALSGTYGFETCSVAPAQFATFAPNKKSGLVTLSNGNRTATAYAYQTYVFLDRCKSSGKWYWEATITSNGLTDYWILAVMGSSALPNVWGGWVSTTAALNAARPTFLHGGADSHTNGIGRQTGAGNPPTSTYYVNNLGASRATSTLGVALDMDARTVSFIRQGVVHGPYALNATDPAFCGYLGYLHNQSFTINTGQTAFVWGPPAGYNPGLYD